MTEQKFSRYDSADYLETEEDVTAYLDAAMAEGGDDPAYVIRALGVVARAKHQQAGTRYRHEPTGPTRRWACE